MRGAFGPNHIPIGRRGATAEPRWSRAAPRYGATRYPATPITWIRGFQTTCRSRVPGARCPEPSLAERARTLASQGRIGSLSTHSRKFPGFPFGSMMPYADDEAGRPVFFISSMAMHTQNLRPDPRGQPVHHAAGRRGRSAWERHA